MKKPTKSIITSSLLAVAFGALSVGSTFALFTSQSKTEVAVESGIVNVESKATLVNYSSSVDGTVHNFDGTETSYTNTLVGNSFSINGDNSIVTIDKMVPGDSLTISLSALNKSNVKTKTRLAVEHSKVGTQKDLFPALKFTFNAAVEPADLFRWQENEAVSEASMATGVALYGNSGIEVTIKFPDGDNGQILFGSENHDNQYQDAACSIAFSLQAVQANADTSPIDEPISVYDGTTYEELGSNNRGWQVQTAANRFEYITSPDFESLSEASTWERAASVEAYQAALAAAQAEIDLLENDPSIGIIVDETPNGGAYNGGTFRITNAKGLAYVTRLGDYLSAKNEIVGIQNGNVNTKYYYYWDWNVSVEINIDLNNLNWKPIIAQFKEFTFNNHTVSYLRVTGANSAGLFANILGITHVKDLIIENANISGDANSSSSSAGALSGNVGGGTITNITVRNAVISNAKYMGGLIGYSYASAVNNNILENISIQGAFHTAGGLTGYNCQEAEQPERYLEGNTLTDVSIVAAESPTKTYFGTFIGRCNTVGNLYCRNNTLNNVTGSDNFCGNIAKGTVVTE